MPATRFAQRSRWQQYLLSVSIVGTVSGICLLFPEHIGYRVVALLLMFSVSVVAMFFDMLPVLVAALLSALVWDFFFIPPRFALRINSTEDLLMLSMYFVIAMLNAVLTFKIRQAQKAARQQEEQQNMLKLYNTLLNSLSHELRTPISTIIGASDNLLDKNSRISEVNKEALLVEISKASFRLNQQVENLLNMSRLESGFIRLKLDWTDISELVYDVVNKTEEQAKTHPVLVSITPGIPLFKIDKGMMEHVLYNLLHNAVCHTPVGSTVHLSASCRADVLYLTVEDNGPGFPQEETEKVFNKFYRLNQARAGGTGLGLSIVKGFVEAHNGRISLEKSATGGARFVMEIPAETSYLNNLKNE